LALADAVVGLTLIVAQQVVTTPPEGNTVLTPPSDSSSHTTTNVVNVFPPPDPQYVIQTEQQGAPVIMQSGFQALNSNGASELANAFDLALRLGEIRKDLILLPAVTEVNHGMQRVVVLTLGLVVAALALWGIIGQAFGSDAHEAFELLMKVPIWCIVALTSLAWYSMVLDAFASLGTLITTSAHGAFGPTLRPDFWSNAGLGVFDEFVGLFMLILLLMFVVKLLANTAFLAFCALVAPVFVFCKTTPWTSHWGDNWFHMVPATAADLLSMLAMMVVAAATLDHLEGQSAFQTILIDVGMLLALPLVQRLFGLEHGHFGARLLQSLQFASIMKGARALSRTAVAAPVAVASATVGASSAPTRTPRWSSGSGPSI
jgi:hypothetical protein